MTILSGVLSTYRLLIKAIGKKHPQGQCSPSRRKNVNKLILLVLLLISSYPVISEQGKGVEQYYNFSLPALPVDKALQQMAQQTGYQLVFSSELVGSLQSPTVKGRYTVEQALSLLLNNTFLSGSVTERGVIVVVPESALKKTNEGIEAMKSKKNLLAATVAFFVGGGSAVVAQGQGDGNKGGFVLEEIVITAQKREQQLQDVSLAVSAFSADMIKAKGIDDAVDLQFSVPSLTVGPNLFGGARVTVRGVGTSNIL